MFPFKKAFQEIGKGIISILLFMLIISSSSFIPFTDIDGLNQGEEEPATITINEMEPHLAESRGPIFIIGNDALESSSVVSDGSGLYSDPYIIQNYEIDASSQNGIQIENTNKYLVIRDCIVENGSDAYDGIYLNNCSNVNISYNDLGDNNQGIRLVSSANNSISNNNCSSGCILLQESNNNTIQHNNFSDSMTGIDLFSSNNNTIAWNNCSNNSDGIRLTSSSDNNTLSNNIIHFSTSIGIISDSSGNNSISGNNCSSNDLYGIFLDDESNNNSLWTNILKDNGNDQAYCRDSDYNDWDNGTVGNYWGDYMNKYPSATNDGIIWNTAYEITGTSDTVDNFPLVHQIYDIQKPTWDEAPSDQTLCLGGGTLNYDVDASDNVRIDTYWINDTDNFNIDNDGMISNVTILSEGLYGLNISVNDTSGNEISAIIAITVQEEDIYKPTWDEDPASQTIYEGLAFQYEVNASDNVQIDQYWVNDTNNFTIDENGVIINITALSLGSYGLNISVNDTSGNEISKIIFIHVIEDTISPGWDAIPSNQTIWEGESLHYDVDASDNVALDQYWVNNTDDFSIDSGGHITNKTILSSRTYGLNISVNDTNGNEISKIISVQVIEDTINPTWDETPQDQKVSIGTAFRYDVNASDNVAIDQYWLNLDVFQIDQNGVITNATILSSGIFYLTIHVSDVNGNMLQADIKITVSKTSSPADQQDNSPPTWDEVPQNQTILVGTAFRYDVNASDNVAIDQYWLNLDVFQIDQNGVITNATNLSVANYYLQIHVNDTSGNHIQTIIKIDVKEREDSDDGSLNIPGYSLVSLLGFGLLIAVFCLQKSKSKVKLT